MNGRCELKQARGIKFRSPFDGVQEAAVLCLRPVARLRASAAWHPSRSTRQVRDGSTDTAAGRSPEIIVDARNDCPKALHLVHISVRKYLLIEYGLKPVC